MFRLTEGTWAFREFRSIKFVRSLVYMQMHACVIWKLINVETRSLPVEMCYQGVAYKNEPRHDYVQSITVFSPLEQILMLRHHISCFSELQEFEKPPIDSWVACTQYFESASWKDGKARALLRPAGTKTTRDALQESDYCLFRYCTSVVRRRRHTFRNLAFVYPSICTRDWLWLLMTTISLSQSRRSLSRAESVYSFFDFHSLVSIFDRYNPWPLNSLIITKQNFGSSKWRFRTRHSKL